MNNKKKVDLTGGLLCMALLLLPVSDALAAKAGKKHSNHAKFDAKLKKRNQPPPDLWIRLRSKLVLPKPSPVHWPVAMLEPELTSPVDRKTGVAAGSAKSGPNLTSTSDRFHATREAVSAGVPSLTVSFFHSPSAIPPGTLDTSAIAEVNTTQSSHPSRPFHTPTEHPPPIVDDSSTAAYLKLKSQEAAYARYREQLQWFSRRKGFLRQSIERATPYLYLIIQDLEAHKLPLDLALLPILESGYDPGAVSHKSASGIWQFMSGTAREYGLSQSDWYDERLDISASTRAAVRFLAHLSRRFHGDWLLALAAYNCGERRVEQAIAANQAIHLPTDFWSLKLPEETMAYVPRLLALSTIFSNPGAHELSLRSLSYRPNLVKVRFEHRMTIENISRLAGLSRNEFTHLNPGFIKGVVAVDRPSELLLPESKQLEFKGRLTLAALAERNTESLFSANFEQAPFCSGESLFD